MGPFLGSMQVEVVKKFHFQSTSGLIWPPLERCRDAVSAQSLTLTGPRSSVPTGTQPQGDDTTPPAFGLWQPAVLYQWQLRADLNISAPPFPFLCSHTLDGAIWEPQMILVCSNVLLMKIRNKCLTVQCQFSYHGATRIKRLKSSSLWHDVFQIVTNILLCMWCEDHSSCVNAITGDYIYLYTVSVH